MKTIIALFMMAFAYVACDTPEPAQGSTKDTVKVNNPDSIKIKDTTSRQ